MTLEQAEKKAEEKRVCAICGHEIEPEDMAEYARPDGEDDFIDEDAHSWCLERLENHDSELDEVLDG